MQSPDEDLKVFLPILEKHFYLPINEFRPYFSTDVEWCGAVRFDNAKVGQLLAFSSKTHQTPSASAIANTLLFSSPWHAWALIGRYDGRGNLPKHGWGESENAGWGMVFGDPPMQRAFEKHISRAFDRALEEYQIYVRGSKSPESNGVETANRQGVPQKTSRSNVFKKRGDYWDIVYAEGESIHMKDSMGLAYLRVLLRDPGMEFHVFDIVQKVRRKSNDLPEQAQPVEELDQKARQEYNKSLKELANERQKAKTAGDLASLQRINEETDFIKRALEEATGLGGRDRTFGNSSERARVNVTKAIKTAIKSISESNPQLGEHLENSIRTGIRCIYDPQPSITWET